MCATVLVLYINFVQAANIQQPGSHHS